MTNAERMKIVYHERKEQNKCVQCGTNLPEGYAYVMCGPCQEKRRAWQRSYRVVCKRILRCAYCGKLIDDRRYMHCSECREKAKIRARELRRKKRESE